MRKSLGKEISIISRKFDIYLQRELNKINISKSEYIFIINTENEGGSSQQAICDDFEIDKAVGARAIASLIKKGLLKREKNDQDKRSYRIYLTDKGLAIKPQIDAILLRWTMVLSQDIETEDIEKIFALLKKMKKNAIKDVNDGRKK